MSSASFKEPGLCSHECHNDDGNGVYKVGTKYYKRKDENDKKASLPKVTVNEVRIISEDDIKTVMK